MDINLEVTPIFSEKYLFLYLLSGLPDEFKVTRIALDIQVNFLIYEKLDVLWDEEEKIPSNSSILYTKYNFH